MTIVDKLGISRAPPTERRAFVVAASAHAVHDGYTDLLYVLLPVWQAEFGLGYAEVGMLRGSYMATMSALQISALVVAESVSPIVALAGGTPLPPTWSFRCRRLNGPSRAANCLATRRRRRKRAAPHCVKHCIQRVRWCPLSDRARRLQFHRRCWQDGTACVDCGSSDPHGVAAGALDRGRDRHCGCHALTDSCATIGTRVAIGSPAPEGRRRRFAYAKAFDHRRLPPAFRYFPYRQRSPHGLSDVLALPFANQGSHHRPDRIGIDPGVRRRCGRKAGVRVFGGSVRRARDGDFN